MAKAVKRTKIEKHSLDKLNLAYNPGRPGRPSLAWEDTNKASNFIKLEDGKYIIVAKGRRLA